MGRLVEDMTRLVGEIQALRGSRQAFRKELGMDVVEICADFADTHSRMAKRTKEERLAFCKNLKRTVGGQQREMRAEMAAARRAWAGQQREMRAEMAAARRPRAGRGA